MGLGRSLWTMFRRHWGWSDQWQSCNTRISLSALTQQRPMEGEQYLSQGINNAINTNYGIIAPAPQGRQPATPELTEEIRSREFIEYSDNQKPIEFRQHAPRIFASHSGRPQERATVRGGRKQEPGVYRKVGEAREERSSRGEPCIPYQQHRLVG